MYYIMYISFGVQDLETAIVNRIQMQSYEVSQAVYTVSLDY